MEEKTENGVMLWTGGRNTSVDGVECLAFREIDKKTISILPAGEECGKPLAIISGYDLQFCFDMSNIKNLRDAEMAADGISQMFYSLMIESLMSPEE